MFARLAVLLAFAGLVSCAVSSERLPGPVELEGEWRVTDIVGEPDVDGSEAFLGFERDGAVYGNSGVNLLRGSWSIDDGFSSSPTASTLRAGPPELMQQEQRMLDALGAVHGARFDGADLVLADVTGDELLRLRRRTPLAELTGTVFYRERIALGPGHELTVELQDVSRADAPADVLARTTRAIVGQVPLPFTLEYRPDDVDPRAAVVVRATITAPDGTLAWTTTDALPVLTNGAPTADVAVLVRRVSR